MNEEILIIDFGSQVTQLIARRIRELNVYCEIHPFNHLPALGTHIKGIVLSGSPASVREDDAPKIDFSAILGKYPVLGVCYGAQLLAQSMGGKVEASKSREYGRAMLGKVNGSSKLFKGIEVPSQVWMSHADTIFSIPEQAEIIASTSDVEVAAFHFKKSDTYAIQFHP